MAPPTREERPIERPKLQCNDALGEKRWQARARERARAGGGRAHAMGGVLRILQTGGGGDPRWERE